MDLHTYAKFARYANSWNLHLVEAKCKFQFAYTQIFTIKEIVAITQNDLLRWRSQQRIETFLSWTSYVAKDVWVFHTIIRLLYRERKEVLTDYSYVWSFSP